MLLNLLDLVEGLGLVKLAVNLHLPGDHQEDGKQHNGDGLSRQTDITSEKTCADVFLGLKKYGGAG